jgi:hypothetical protein
MLLLWREREGQPDLFEYKVVSTVAYTEEELDMFFTSKETGKK